MKKYLVFILLLSSFGYLFAQPLDDIVERRLVVDRQTLPYAPIREADIFWEKRVWRIIDVREKINQTFVYPSQPFFSLLTDGALNGEVTLYSAEDESFQIPLELSEIEAVLFDIDTIEIIDPTTELPEVRVVRDEINYEDVKRFRVKELWFFDSKQSTLQVRILGIAPLIEVYDDFGNFRYERPLFWVHYPGLRSYLSHYTVFNAGNDRSLMSWEDWLEMRFFSSTIYKMSNIHDRRLSEYLEGPELLQEADKLKQEIFNFEHDLWSY